MAETIIKDGTGTGFNSKVDGNNQLHTFAVSTNVIDDATIRGLSYNVNTGTIGLTSTTESAVLYFKNDESPINGESDIIIDAIAVGIGSGTVSDSSTITVVRNPTGGTIISGASAVSTSANRNFGSSNSLSTTSLAYKGAEGSTITGGSDFGQFFQAAGSRGYYTIGITLSKGSSIAIKIDTQTSAGTTNVYAALILHRRDGKNE